MVKKTNKRAVRPKRKQNKQPRIVSRMQNNLDSAAIAYAKMLVDPCNAPMSAPTYSGMGTGQYRRIRRIFNSGTAVEGTYSFNPASNQYFFGTHSELNAGTFYTIQKGTLFGSGEIGSEVETRCLAACVKIRYIGSEQLRAGVVATRTNPFNYLIEAQGTTAADEIARSPEINRVGEVQHEVKFVPGSADEIFTTSFDTTVTRATGAFGFSFQGVPAGTLQIEVTAIIELEPTGVYIGSVVPPTSRSTTSQVLAALGPPARWAFGHVVAPTIRAMAGAASGTSISALSAASTGIKLLTL